MHACRGTWGCSCSYSCLTLLTPDSDSDPDPDPTHGVVARERERKSLRLSLALRSALLTQSRSRSVSSPLTISYNFISSQIALHHQWCNTHTTTYVPPSSHPPISQCPVPRASPGPLGTGHWALGTPLRLNFQLFQLSTIRKQTDDMHMFSARSAVPGPEAQPLRISKPAFALAACKFLSHIFYH